MLLSGIELVLFPFLCVYQYPDYVIVSRLYVKVDWTYLIQL